MLAAALFCAAVTMSGAAFAQDMFFKGKTLIMLSPSTPGGSYDFYARIAARYMTEYLPGKPNYVVQNMPGAGGMKAGNYIYNIAPKDGTVMGLMNQTLAHYQMLLDTDGVQYDVGKFTWIGRVAPTITLVMVWGEAPAKTVEDMKTVETLFGASSALSQSYMIPMIMKNLLGYKTRPIVGFSGAAEIYLAMERGEVHGRTGSAETVVASHPDWFKTGKMRVLAQLGAELDPDAPPAPLLVDLAPNEEARKIIEFFQSYTVFGNPYAGPPGIPAARTKMLRDSFVSAVKDPGFLADMKKSQMAVGPMSGEDLQKIAEAVSSTDPAIIAKAKAVLK
ncbi:tripartite tricarboxylate transporter substrate-binding protein [Devosia sp.]|uniref:Bug family tripartite tricarboxylate transporter substrate binding protein n=1 Tax=Devosia sp. TaxID=1871048 RepID=UPI002631D85A|nr:tripartite tricarboxylate transporter substrate-binding protein [Devosia sp.]